MVKLINHKYFNFLAHIFTRSYVFDKSEIFRYSLKYSTPNALILAFSKLVITTIFQSPKTPLTYRSSISPR